MRCTLFPIYLLLFNFTLFAQSPEGPLLSYGQAPSFIQQHASFVERPPLKREVDPMDNSHHEDIILSQVLNSGKVVFGDTISTLVQEIVNSLQPSVEIKAYVLKSNRVFTFSTKNNELLVSTGLIAKASTIDELAFFIAREIEIIKLSEFLTRKKTFQKIPSYENKIDFLLEYDSLTTLKIDSLGLITYLQNGYNPEAVVDCIELLTNEYMPFGQIKIPENYFTTNLFFVPESFFDVYSQRNGIPWQNSTLFTQVENANKVRSEHLNKQLSLKQTALSNSTSSEIELLFKRAQQLCQYECARQDIINGHFNDAIYSICLLESIHGSTDYIDLLKAHAWMGYAAQKIGNAKPQDRMAYQNMLAPNTELLLLFRQLDANGVSAFATRIIYDLKEKHKAPAFEAVWEGLIRVMTESDFFEISKFSRIPFDAALKNHIEEKGEHVGFDSTKFYFYGLSDLIRDNVLFSEIERISEQKKGVPENSSLHLVSSAQFRKSNRKLKQDKSTKYNSSTSGSVDALESKTSLLLSSSAEDLPYNDFALVQETFSQNYRHSNYKAILPPLYGNELGKLNREHDYTSFCKFESTYRLKVKGYHFIGLFVVPLPFVVPEMLMTSFQSKHAVLTIENRTGKIVQLEYQKFYEPLTEKLIKNRIYHMLPNTY